MNDYDFICVYVSVGKTVKPTSSSTPTTSKPRRPSSRPSKPSRTSEGSLGEPVDTTNKQSEVWCGGEQLRKKTPKVYFSENATWHVWLIQIQWELCYAVMPFVRGDYWVVVFHRTAPSEKCSMKYLACTNPMRITLCRHICVGRLLSGFVSQNGSRLQGETANHANRYTFRDAPLAFIYYSYRRVEL